MNDRYNAVGAGRLSLCEVARRGCCCERDGIVGVGERWMQHFIKARSAPCVAASLRPICSPALIAQLAMNGIR